MKKSRSQIFKDLDVKPKNSRWAWCAKNDRLKIAVFTIWEDKEKEESIWVLHNENEPNKTNGYRDQKRVLDLCIEKNYTAYGLLAQAVNPKEATRRIESIKEDSLLKLNLKEIGNEIIGKKVGEISFLNFITGPPSGKEIPDRAIKKGISFKRDAKVRAYLLNRANGACEYCGVAPFELEGGESYLESHPIIALASDGKNTLQNVIALCPNHHREAHYGKKAESLEMEFIEIVKKKMTFKNQ
jgi:5-methylcytosine-specific restriction protein A